MTQKLIDLDSPCQPIDSGEMFESYILENVSLTTNLGESNIKVGCGYTSAWDEWWSESLNSDE
jgi:hypothetical protein